MNPLRLVIAAQIFFLAIGFTFLRFHISLLDIATSIMVAIGAEWTLAYLSSARSNRRIQLSIPESAVAAALGICLFFRSASPWYFALAVFLAVASKYAIRTREGHLFNPSNFGIVTTAFLFPAATTITFTQWGSNVYVYLLIALIAFGISYYAGAFRTTISFMLSYTVFLIATAQLFPSISYHHYGLIGPSLTIFASFMITDPRTSPRTPGGRVLHGMSVASAFFILELLGMRYAIFLASFVVTILNAISRRVVQLFPRIHAFASNALAAVVLVLSVLLMLGYIAVLRVTPFSATTLSPTFLLMGVESQRLTACAAHPVFVRRVVPPDASATTSGVAWGDFNNDGYDDLFVSNLRGPSKLYENDRHGGFTDITATSGLPTMTAQSAFFVDYDNDGREDLFVVFGMDMDSRVPTRAFMSAPTQEIRVFHNIGGHRFEEVTHALGLDRITGFATGGSLSFGDYNNDGWIDFILTARGNTLDITPSLAFAQKKSFFDPAYTVPTTLLCSADSVRAAFSSFDVTHRFGIDVDSFVKAGGCAYAFEVLPLNRFFLGLSHAAGPFGGSLFMPGHVELFENRNGTSFREHTEFSQMIASLKATGDVDVTPGQYPYESVSGMFYQALSFDYDRDGKQDVFLAVDHGASVLLKNEGGFAFRPVTRDAGVAYAGTAMGADVSDYDHNGSLDIAVNNIHRIYLYQNVDGHFANSPAGASLDTAGTPWGMMFLDYDLDGWPDLYIANGTADLSSDATSPGIVRDLFRTDLLYRNIVGKFLDASSDLCATSEFTQPAAVSDYDDDGDPDIFVGRYENASDSNALYVNSIAHENRHFLELHLVGTISNRDAIGAIVTVSESGQSQTQALLAGNSFYSQQTKTLLFGIGASSGPVSVSIVWPSGRRTELKHVAVDQRLTVTE